MFGFNHQQKQEKHFLPACVRQGQPEASGVQNVIGLIGVVCAIGGGIVSLFNGLNAADRVYCEFNKQK